MMFAHLTMNNTSLQLHKHLIEHQPLSMEIIMESM